LLKLNQTTYVRALDVAEAAVARAQAAVERATLAVTQLPPDATPGQIESAQAELRLAQADRQLAVSQVAQAQADLNQTELRATIAGTIAMINVSAGEQVDAGETVATIGDLSAWLIQTTDVSELEVVRIAVGDRATATFAALPGQTLSGHVDSIELRGTNENGGIPLFTVTIRPDVTLPQLRWNMSANVSIEPSS
jgi:HlyD family secretion protein